MSTPEVNGGISRSGRIRKKSTRLMEMEESELTPHVAVTDRVPTVKFAPPTPQTPNRLNSKKKLQPTKLKITIGGQEVLSDSNNIVQPVQDEDYVPVLEQFQCEELITEEVVEDSVPEPVTNAKTVPSLKIKFNASKGTAELDDRRIINSQSSAKMKRTAAANGSEASQRKRRRKSPAHNDVPHDTVGIQSNHVNNNSEEHQSLSTSNISNHSLSDLAAAASAALVKDSVDLQLNNMSLNETVAKSKKRKTPLKGTRACKSDPSTPKKTNITAYTLWCRENRPKVQKSNPEMDFASASRALGEIWQNLPNNEKLQWKLKAEKLKNGAVMMKETGPPVSEPPNKNHNASVRAADSQRLPVRRIVPAAKPVSRTERKVAPTVVPFTSVKPREAGAPLKPVELSAYIRLLGESMSLIGRRMREQRDQQTDSRSLSPLLDSTLCALAPLLALTTLDPRMNGCDPSVHNKTLENITFIMPGI